MRARMIAAVAVLGDLLTAVPARADYEVQTAVVRAGKAVFASVPYDENGDRSIDGYYDIGMVSPPPPSIGGLATGAGTVATPPLPGVADVGTLWAAFTHRKWDAVQKKYLPACRTIWNPAGGTWSIYDTTNDSRIALSASCVNETTSLSFTATWTRNAYTPGFYDSFTRFAWPYLYTDASGAQVGTAIDGIIGYASTTVCIVNIRCVTDPYNDIWRMYESTTTVVIDR